MLRGSLDRLLVYGYLSSMKRASITQTKNGLSSLIDGLKGGEAVLIVDRGRPVARLEPIIGGEEGGPGGRVARLVRDGVLRPRRTVAPAAVFTSPPPVAGASAVGALIDERRDGR
jgi:antitoxin (DNA-binding transcriptional repressor) of toxin-antitoxin stability system